MFLNFVNISQKTWGEIMFYDVYVSLCRKMGKKPSAVAEELGINKSNVTNWKKNGYTPRGEALQRIADYFGVTTDVLLGKQAGQGPRPITDDDMMFALWGDTTDVDQDDLEDVKRYAAFVRERKRKQ